MDELETIKSAAFRLGFDACGAARYRTLNDEAKRFGNWLAEGRHAGMRYLEKYLEQRKDPALLLENCRTVLVCCASYPSETEYGFPGGRPEDPPCSPPEPPIPNDMTPAPEKIARYARYPDYHYILKKRLFLLLEQIREFLPGTSGRIFVDTAPVMEKIWAREAGLGWIGKNTLLVRPGAGTFHFLGIVLLNRELNQYDKPFTGDGCGNCRRCIEACPTGALSEKNGLDARRCIAYHTIENRNEVPEEVAAKLNGRIFGCDDCQLACPHNSASPQGSFFQERAENLTDLSEEDWLSLGHGEFRRKFGHTPLSRAGLKKIQRTILQNRAGSHRKTHDNE